jgi:hypothetical protein
MANIGTRGWSVCLKTTWVNNVKSDIDKGGNIMESSIPGTWKAKKSGKIWQILDKNGSLIATVAYIADAEDKARLIATSPYMLQALKAIIKLIGDEDLPDNGELSGAAICDLVRSAVMLVEGNES